MFSKQLAGISDPRLKREPVKRDSFSDFMGYWGGMEGDPLSLPAHGTPLLSGYMEVEGERLTCLEQISDE